MSKEESKRKNNNPKFHHYVPRFYLSRFVNKDNKLWVFDKQSNKTFASIPDNIGGQKQFYRLADLPKDGIDPLEMEKQFAYLENEFSKITNDWFLQFIRSNKLIIPDINRNIVSLFIATQLLRTVEAREILAQFVALTEEDASLERDIQGLHFSLLWNDDFVNEMKDRISNCIWIFGRNNSSTPFCTSDHPVLIKSSDNEQWLLGPRIFDEGMYIVYPLSPSIVMYCKDPAYWGKLRVIENSISPVDFTDDMVMHENSGQIGMSYRFVYSQKNDFNFVNEFLAYNEEFKSSQRRRF